MPRCSICTMGLTKLANINQTCIHCKEFIYLCPNHKTESINVCCGHNTNKIIVKPKNKKIIKPVKKKIKVNI